MVKLIENININIVDSFDTNNQGYNNIIFNIKSLECGYIEINGDKYFLLDLNNVNDINNINIFQNNKGLLINNNRVFKEIEINFNEL